MKTNPNDSICARPYSHDERPSGGHEGDRPETFQAFTGLTKREYFAAMAMQGLISNSGPDHLHAKIAIEMADDLIVEFNKSEL